MSRPGMPARSERAAEAAALRAQGLLQREIADQMGLSRSYTSALLCDPDGTKEIARKESYRGECEVCGAPTTGSDGPSQAPKRCAACSHPDRYWTEERIIFAIQDWARRFGEPPRSQEWDNCGTHDDGQRWPAKSQVYAEAGPFPEWADAIESAGFPRPIWGGNKRPKGNAKMTNTNTRDYVVFRVNDDGKFDLIGEAHAWSGQAAVEEIASEPGSYATAPKNSVQRHEVAMRLVTSPVRLKRDG